MRNFASDQLRHSPRTDVDEFDELCEKVRNIILSRCRIVDPQEVVNTDRLITSRFDFWKSKGVQHYGDAGNYGILHQENYFPLLYANSAEVREEILVEKRSLPIPTSMRGVDTESVVSVYSEIGDGH
jgi:hypothetical protein